jgi:hypothetical protein
LRLNPELVENIRCLAFDGLKSLPRRGAEIGGLIVADAPGSASQDVRTVKCEYLFGPSFHLSAKDLPELREAVSEARAEGKTVLAYFRSNTRPEMNVEAEDREAMAFACPDVANLVLATPSMSGSARLGVFSRDSEGKWIAGEQFTAGPTMRAKAPPAPIEEPAAVEPPAPARPIAPAPRPRLTVRAWAWSDGRDRWAWWAAAILSCAACTTGLWMAVHRGRPAPPARPAAAAPVARPKPRDAGLGLAVREENGKLHVLWNRDSAAAAAAVSGAVDIADGADRSSIALRPADITGGSLVYTPRSGDVTFWVRLTGPEGKPVSEMIRVVGSAAPAPRPLRKVLDEVDEDSYADAPPADYRPTRTVTPPVAQHPVENRPSPAQQRMEQPRQTALTSTPAAPAGTPEPSVRERIAPQPIASSANGDPAATSIPAAPAPVVTPPKPIREVKPSMRDSIRWVVPAPVSIGILVSIDSKGRVKGAHPDENNSGKNLFLTGLAVSAAKEWTFQPATRNGEAVPGEYRIQFVFAPTSN